MNNPDAYIVSQRLKQLVAYYGTSQVQGEVLWEMSQNETLKWHVNNLMLTYGVDLVLSLTEIICYDKVG